MLKRLSNILCGFGFLGIVVALPLYLYFLGLALDTYGLLNESTISFFGAMPEVFTLLIPISAVTMIIYGILSVFYILLGGGRK